MVKQKWHFYYRLEWRGMLVMLWWEDKEVNFGHVKLMACQLGEVSVRQLRWEIGYSKGQEWEVNLGFVNTAACVFCFVKTFIMPVSESQITPRETLKSHWQWQDIFNRGSIYCRFYDSKLDLLPEVVPVSSVAYNMGFDSCLKRDSVPLK